MRAQQMQPILGMRVAVVVVMLGLTSRYQGTAAQTVGDVGEAAEAEMVWLEPGQLQVVEGSSQAVRWFTLLPDVGSVTAMMDDPEVARVAEVGPVERGFPDTTNFTFSGSINVTGIFVGYNKMRVDLFDGLGVVVGGTQLPMSVLLSYQNLSDIFMLIVSVLVALLYVIMGATLDFDVIKRIVKKPFGPFVGIVCQYIFMPLIAFGLAKVTFPDNPLGQLGLFLGGCCPGGGASNMWTHLLGGSLDLSIMMTFVSTVTAFATVPLWVLLMGPLIIDEADFVIPYKDITVLVFSLSVPCAVGMLIAKFLPRVSAVLAKMLTPVTLFNVVFLFTFGVYANLYVFALFEVKTVMAGFGLPSLGYLSGLGLASLFRLPFHDRIAICIETGIQNMTIAIVILKLTLESPASELTVVFPAAAVVMTPIPLILALIVRRAYLWYRGPEEEKDEKEIDGVKSGGKTATEGGKEETDGGKVERRGEKVERDGGKVERSGGKVERSGGKVERDGGKVERNGTATVVDERGIDNPAVEVEDTF